jgi:hypothetical protein
VSRCIAGAALVLIALGLTPPAGAAVDVGPTRIAVTSGEARATVTRRPFRIRFADASGRGVLAQVPNRRSGPLLIPPTPDPEPLGTDNLAGPSLYAPLTFTVGAQANLQYPASPWVANQLTGVQTGFQYSALEEIGRASCRERV